MKTGFLLMNIGTPSEPTIKGIRSYLTEFLSDPDVIDTNPILRWIIVNLFVSPFRPKRVLPQYQSIWTDEGSPLLVYSNKFKEALVQHDNQLNVEIGMRYGEPSIEKGIIQLLASGVNEVVLCPMFPQYAQATTGSCISKAIEILEEKKVSYKTITEFFREQFYIDCLVETIQNSPAYLDSDMLLFSFHGLPERQIKKLDASGSYCLKNQDCCNSESSFNQFCYRFHCVSTVNSIMEKLNTKKPFKICFQSRFGMDKWIQPDILDVLQQSVNESLNNIGVVCPSFVADCLETLEEISIRDQEYFTEIGGGQLSLVPSLNISPKWVSGFAKFLASQTYSNKGQST
ncbi:MAG: ferrochelatase [Chloroflexota bacterium]|nr:ferrochelatase [Chloroflexota bacterium]MED6296351.1 ferrochelatase [Chloroflexota bacterium]